ncbi:MULTISPECIES: ATP-binding protein [Streptomyces]|uniref:histidine kinase n=1 Tax=Streptomyces venezuelae TaxID=54571 RepID=A0A5P2BFF7_STRVZ|nr:MULTISPECIES: ATP-binding protein [Streptomyces]NEA03140.1 HAMP domain-containing protein [Streptomyces sp. SID10116]MYY84940.1 HAMP domain-containing protein [Streptomyces sp. SID335]MYZ16785.1 HAMP domain-containing protein [Streptomyces sp. SID337]NDZ90615.1 HAMP domain-containing protein [Streptomyces sp. SID10115]NEB49336.1 HAMP domain-containing protein [Streptomyces sp. SID339]
MSSERARLTALYGGLLVLAGALLTGLVYLLVQQGLYTSISSAVTTAVPRDPTPPWRHASPFPVASAVPAQRLRGTTPDADRSGLAVTKISDLAGEAALSRLLTVSVIVFTVYAVLSIALAWWMAGRVLRPVGVITDLARRLSGANLHERIALAAPPGELKRLADTFDEMLDRIERLVGAQQRFAADAAHELRTPLAVQRAAAEIGLAGDPDPERVARIRTKLISVADDSEHLVEGLLLLADSEQGLERREPVAVDVLAHAVADGLADEAAARGVTVSVRAEPLTVTGDGVLLDRLVHNLVANAVRYNAPEGRVSVAVGADGTLEVANTGPEVPPDTVPHLFEPFRRLHERTHARGEGAGLGLSIVSAIAQAHEAEVMAEANGEGGGLRVRVVFAPAPAA